MATSTLPTTAAVANPASEIYDLATDLQVRASRIVSLASGIDNAADQLVSGPNRPALSSVCNFAALIEREAKDLSNMGERIEVLSMGLKREAREG